MMDLNSLVNLPEGVILTGAMDLSCSVAGDFSGCASACRLCHFRVPFSAPLEGFQRKHAAWMKE